MQISTKPTVYLIDGLNFVRGFLYRDFDSEEHKVKKFADWLEGVSRLDVFGVSEFKIIFDGVYRDVGSTIRGNLHISFSDDVKADELIFEQAVYLKSAGRRVVIVTNDAGLTGRAEMEKIKVLTCGRFYELCNAVGENSFNF